MSKEVNLDGVIADLQAATGQLDGFAQAATADNDDQVLRARMTQCLVLCGTALEILGGLAVAAKAAKAQEEAAAAAGSDSDIDG